MLPSAIRRAAIVAPLGMILVALVGCSGTASASSNSATTSTSTAAHTPSPTTNVTAIGDEWLIQNGTSDDSSQYNTWLLNTAQGTLKLVSQEPMSDRFDLLRRWHPDLVSGDGRRAFGDTKADGTTVAVIHLGGGTGTVYDITTVPGFQPGDKLLDAKFDLSTASRFDVEVGSGSDKSWWQWDDKTPDAKPVKVAAPATGNDDSSVLPWGTKGSGGVLTLNSGEQWQASVSSNTVSLFKRANDTAQWTKVGKTGMLQDQAQLTAGLNWFRPVNVTTLVK